MKPGSPTAHAALLFVAYGFALLSLPLIFSRDDGISNGYRYILLVTGVLLLLAAHGSQLIRRRKIRRLWQPDDASISDTSTDVSMAMGEVFLGWLGVMAVLVLLYHAAPADELAEWYPRLFLCLTVFFGAMYRRALIFVYAALPFVLTISILSLWRGLAYDPAFETAAKAALVAADLALLAWCAWLTRRHGVFSASEFDLVLGPGIAGGRLSGVIRGWHRDVPAEGYQLDLSCIRQTKDKHGSAQGEVLWHSRRRVRGYVAGEEYGPGSVPVIFDLPDGAPGSSNRNGVRVTWMLRASAHLADSDYSCVFETPVAEEGQERWNPLAPEIEHAAGALPPAPKPYFHASDGHAVFDFQSRWTAASELIATAFLLFWFQLMWLAAAETGWETWLMFAAGLGFLGVLLAPWLRSYRVEISGGQITVETRILFWKSRKTFAPGEIESVEAVPGGQRTGLAEPTAYSAIRLRTRSGAAVTAGAHFRECASAEAAAEQLRQAVEAAAKPRPKHPQLEMA